MVKDIHNLRQVSGNDIDQVISSNLASSHGSISKAAIL
jgi:hypothetical protein